MENTYQKSLKARIAGGVAAVGLAACCMTVPAFAAELSTSTNDGNGNTLPTDVEVQTDPGSTQITWEAPTKISFAADASGALTAPSEDVFKITNKSVFPIHVTNVSAAQEEPFNLVSSVTAGTEANAIQFSLKTGNTAIDAATGLNTSANADYNMGYAGSSTDTITVEASGNIARTTVDLSTAKKAATISWTVAAGAASQA